MDGTGPCPGPPPGFPLLSPHLEDKTQTIPISSFLLNLALSHPMNPESYLFFPQFTFHLYHYIYSCPFWASHCSIYIYIYIISLLFPRYPYLVTQLYTTILLNPHQSNHPLTTHLHSLSLT